MKYKVLVLDIDGTLVNSKKEITLATKEGIALALDKGVKVVIASGRPTPGVLPIARELELTKRGGYILSFNGGKIINCQTKEIIYEKNISKDLIPVLEELADYHKVNMMTYEEEAIITKTPNDSYIAIEADITKFVDIVDARVRECFPDTNLKRIRTIYGCTQAELAEMSDVSLRSIQM